MEQGWLRARGIAIGQTIVASGSRVDRWEAWCGLQEVDVCRSVDAARLLRLLEPIAR